MDLFLGSAVFRTKNHLKCFASLEGESFLEILTFQVGEEFKVTLPGSNPQYFFALLVHA